MQIEEFYKHYSVIAVDMPLHGKSRPYSGFTYENVAKDIYELLRSEGISNVAVVGQSGGGFIAQSIALFHPEIMGAFISVGSTPFGKYYYTKMELFLIEHYMIMAMCYPWKTYISASTKAASVTEEGRKAFRSMLERLGRKDTLAAADRYYKEFSKYPEVDFKCPVLLMVGDSDKIGYVQRYNRMWTERTGFPLVVIPSAGHNVNYDNPKFFNDYVLNFLKENIWKQF